MYVSTQVCRGHECLAVEAVGVEGEGEGGGVAPLLQAEAALQCTATHFHTLQHTATPCNTLQHTATRCNTLQQLIVPRCSILSMRVEAAALQRCVVL